MKKDSNILWLYPSFFFIFLAIFVTFKFIVIFFFRAAYAPQVIFDLTPVFILSGVNELQMLFITFIVVVLNAYLHFILSKKTLTYSLLFSALMLCGLGITITSEDMTISHLLHYILFTCLLCAILLDHKHSLILPDYAIVGRGSVKPIVIQKKPVSLSQRRKKPIITEHGSVITKARARSKHSRFSLSFLWSILSLLSKNKKLDSKHHEQIKKKKLSLNKNKKSSSSISITRIDVTEEKTGANGVHKFSQNLENNDTLFDIQQKLHDLDRKINNMKQKEKGYDFHNQREKGNIMSSDPSSSLNQSLEYDVSERQIQRSADNVAEEAQKPPIVFDIDTKKTAVIQQGIIKKISSSFAGLLGYKPEDLINKRLLTIIAKDGLSTVREYYFNRLNGCQESSYTTTFSTKNNDTIQMNVTVTPTIYNGKKAEIISI